MNNLVLVPIIAVTVALIGAAAQVISGLIRPKIPTPLTDVRIAELERRIGILQDDNEGYYDRLKTCEDQVRQLSEELYQEKIGHQICERHLSAALKRLGDLDAGQT